MKERIIVTKASGEHELFSAAKLRRSLERANAPAYLIDDVVQEVKNELHGEIATSDIYARAFSLLRKKHRLTATRYHLKYALMELGPTGHLFEKFVGELLKAQGFEVKVGKIVEGYCVSHEVDVSAIKNNRHIMVECKFHNQLGIKSDVKVALYVKARFEDIAKKYQQERPHSQKFHEAWLVTNTKLTTDAVRYASCANMKAIAWGYPSNGSLQYLIEQTGLHPITCLTSLAHFQKQQLLARGFILCKDIVQNKNLLKSININEAKTTQIFKEIHELCGIL